MDRIVGAFSRWGHLGVAIVFFILWCVGEAGRMGGGDWTAFFGWPGGWMLVAVTASIALSRWAPYLSLSVTAALLVAQLFHLLPFPQANHWAIYLGSFIALGFILWTAPVRTAWIATGVNALFLGAMTVLMVSAHYGNGVGWFLPTGVRMLPYYGPGAIVSLSTFAAVISLPGLLLRLRGRQVAAFKERQETEATLHLTEMDLVVEQERGRISRDLHDVLAHSLAVIAAQADGARYLGADQPQPVLDALKTIAASARTALDDAQRVVQGTETGESAAPQPRLEDLEPLLDHMRSSLKVHRTDSGEPVALTEGQQVAVYRIIQECLTNALRHGGQGSTARLHLDWQGPGLTLHVASTGQASAQSAPGTGRGIPGMQERAHLAGGWLVAGPDGEDFRVTAFIPYGQFTAPAPPDARPAVSMAGADYHA